MGLFDRLRGARAAAAGAAVAAPWTAARTRAT